MRCLVFFPDALALSSLMLAVRRILLGKDRSLSFIDPSLYAESLSDPLELNIHDEDFIFVAFDKEIYKFVIHLVMIPV